MTRVLGLWLLLCLGCEASSARSPQQAQAQGQRLMVDGGAQVRARTLVVLVRHASAPAPTLTVADVEARMAQVNALFDEYSGGRAGVVGKVHPDRGADVVGWYTDPGSACDDPAAYLALASADLDVTGYDRTVFIIAQRSGCNVSAYAVGASVHMSVPNASVSTLTHELGHTFLASTSVGYGHADFLDCGPLAWASSGCTVVRYGDPYDVMGAGGTGHFSAHSKDVLGWFGPHALKEVTASGVYVLEPYETLTWGLKALKVRGDLYVEYRQPVGADTALGSFVYEGALFHSGNFLLNTSPPTLTYVGRPTDAQLTPTLRLGETFVVDGVGVFRVLARNSSGLTLDVALQAPTVLLRANGATGTLAVEAPASVDLCWTAAGINVTCAASSTGWTGTWPGSNCVSLPTITAPSPQPQVFTIRCSNPQGSSSDSVAVTVIEPTAPPTVSMWASSAFGQSTGTVTLIAPAGTTLGWSASRASLGCVHSGAWAGLHVANVHTEDVVGLPVGRYQYDVSCANALGTATDQLTLEVVAPPTFRFLNPAGGSLVDGTVDVSGALTQPALVKFVMLFVDGNSSGFLAFQGVPQTRAWDTTQVSDGPHVLSTSVQSTDNRISPGPSLSVMVANVDRLPPTVTVLPLPARVRGAVTLNATASDDGTLRSVQFLVDGVPMGVPLASAPFTAVWDSERLPDGAHSISAQAVDAVGRTGVAAPIALITDNTAPVISGLVIAPGQTGATVTWTSNEPATTQVDFGLSASLGSSTPLDPALDVNHHLTLSMLVPATTYFLEASAQDSLGNRSRSNVLQFVTLPPCGTFHLDHDGDSYGDPSQSLQTCAPPAGFVVDGTDCDDANASVHPGANEVCNGVDDDCDLVGDEDALNVFYQDADGDGQGGPVSSTACTAPVGSVANHEDCDDSRAEVLRQAREQSCVDGLDDDCDGAVDAADSDCVDDGDASGGPVEVALDAGSGVEPVEGSCGCSSVDPVSLVLALLCWVGLRRAFG